MSLIGSLLRRCVYLLKMTSNDSMMKNYFQTTFFLLIINLVLYVKKLDRTFSTPTQQLKKKNTVKINLTMGKSDIYCVCNIPIMHNTRLLRKHNYIPWIVKHRMVYILYWSHIRKKRLSVKQAPCLCIYIQYQSCYLMNCYKEACIWPLFV